MKQTFVMEWDDLQFGKPGLDMILKLKEHYPDFKCTLFMTPIPEIILRKKAKPVEYKSWANYLKQDWIEICPHGLQHAKGEMEFYYNKGKKKDVTFKDANLMIDAAEHTFKQLNLPFKKIWRSPFWQTSKGAYKALWDKGYTVAVDPNQDIPSGGPIYLYNWSTEKPVPYYPLVKGHGHLYGLSTNTIHKCMDKLLNMPSDAEFKFVSEVI